MPLQHVRNAQNPTPHTAAIFKPLLLFKREFGFVCQNVSSPPSSRTTTPLFKLNSFWLQCTQPTDYPLLLRSSTEEAACAAGFLCWQQCAASAGWRPAAQPISASLMFSLVRLACGCNNRVSDPFCRQLNTTSQDAMPISHGACAWAPMLAPCLDFYLRMRPFCLGTPADASACSLFVFSAASSAQTLPALPAVQQTT